MQLFWLLGLDYDVPLWLLVVLGFAISYYQYMTWNFSVFKKLGLPGPKPVPILGNLGFYFKEGFRCADSKMIEQYGHYVGVFMGRQPEIVTDDVSFLKHVLVKDFNNFIDRNNLEFAQKPVNRSLTSLRGEEWKTVRNTLTPTFSAGKMKRMNGKINGCISQFVEVIDDHVQEDKTFDLLDIAGNFTMDVIARTGFGLEINCQKEKNNPFLKHAKKTMSGGLKNPFMAMLFFFPFATKLFTKIGLITTMPRDAIKFFSDIGEQTLQMKQSSTGKKEQDFMQLMSDAHKDELNDEDDEEDKEAAKQHHKKKTLTKDDILGNALLFFLAGYETTANTLCFAGYYLAKNPQVQEKVIEEIEKVVGDKEPKYENLMEMPYLEQFFCEVLRLQPQAPKLTRHCEKDTTINGQFVPAGMQIGIPVCHLHMNPDVWPEPEKFDPNRFSPEEKASRDPYNYQPFGLGPRACIGMRLAQMEMKMAVIGILQKFRLKTCAETENPIKLHKLRPKPENGMFLKAEKK